MIFSSICMIMLAVAITYLLIWRRRKSICFFLILAVLILRLCIIIFYRFVLLESAKVSIQLFQMLVNVKNIADYVGYLLIIILSILMLYQSIQKNRKGI